MNAVGETKQTSVPEELSSSTAKLVYLYLVTAETATADQLRSALGIEKLTLLPVLRRLENAGLVETTDEGYAAVR